MNRRWKAKQRSPTTGFYVLTHVLVLVHFACCGAVGAIADCIRLAPRFLSEIQRKLLCTESHSSAPAECAQAAIASTGSQKVALVIELCRGAHSEMPGVCFTYSSRGTTKALSPEYRVELCKNADSDVPAKCAEKLMASTRQPRVLVGVCKRALSMAPADCYNLLPRNMPENASTRLCVRAETTGPAACTRFRGLFGQYGLDVTTRLCEGAPGQGPAECFYRTAFFTKFSVDDRIKLCNGASTDAPARCAIDVRDHRLGPQERVALCRGASGSSPARCAQAAPPILHGEDLLSLCQYATESKTLAPILCFKMIIQELPTAIALALCAGATDSSPAECARSARHALTDLNTLQVLCRHATSAFPADCFKATFRAGANQRVAAELCHAATSWAPSRCFAEAPKHMSAALRAETCTGAHSTAPAACLAAAMPRSLLALSSEGFCPLESDTGRVPRRGLDDFLASQLCKHATDDGPAECGRAAPSRMVDEDVMSLCEASGKPVGRITAQCAARAIAVGIALHDAALLCRGARSDAPVECMTTLSPWLRQDTRLALCIGARSEAPGRCINSLPVLAIPTPDQIAECRTSIPRPSALRITSLGYDGELLHPNQPMQATLDVLDQWGGEMPGDKGTLVRACVAQWGSNGAFVNAHGRLNATEGGVVYFSQLSFSAAGNLTLHFSIDNDASARIPLAAAHIVVVETEHDAIVRQCAGIFSFLACPARDARCDRDVEESVMVPSTFPEAVSLVVGGTAAAWHVLMCSQVLEEDGVRVAILPGTNESLRAWLWYHPGIELLEAGIGLPSREQLPWERLMIERDADLREVRKAFYRQSLLWHPDRWVRYPRRSARAQEIFEIVNEGYSSLVRELRVRKQSDEQMNG